jgi:uncharacterized protein YndB with AHSA1/START domain
MSNQRRELNVSIAATPDEVWRAITDPEMTRRYYYGTDIVSTWEPGAEWTSVSGDELYLKGRVVEVDPARRLVQTFHVEIEEPAASDPLSTVTWELTPNGDGTQLKLVHEDLAPATFEYTDGGWEHILGGLKTLLESPEPSTVAGAQMAR